MNRRDFIRLSTATAGLALFSGCASSQQPTRKLDILVLGGTNFLGPAVVEQAFSNGHNVTLFNRGITRPELFPALEKLRGNRSVNGSDLSALGTTRRWDVVIDVWPEHASLVDETTKLLQERADYYYFCSSIAVYQDFSSPGLNETSAVHSDRGWYGGEKAHAEKLVASRFADRYGVCRCHSIFGPRDNGVAFHYWLRRIALQDKVLAPGTGLDPIQYTDARDVAAWIIACAENKTSGTYNICGNEKLLFSEFLEQTRSALGSQCELVWVDADFLRVEQNINSFLPLPLWAPLDEDAGFFQIDGGKAVRDGARYRPFSQTAQDSWRWYQSHFFKDTYYPIGAWGMSLEKEQEVLAAWSAK